MLMKIKIRVKKELKLLDTTDCIVFEVAIQKSNPKVQVEFYRPFITK